MQKLSRKEIDARAQKLWNQREHYFKFLMLEMHRIADFQTMSWDKAPRDGKDFLRRKALWLHENGKPNDWMQCYDDPR
jgi:hypothetical protein